MGRKWRLKMYGLCLFFLFWALTEFYPLAWMFYSSLKANVAIIRDVWGLPTSFYLNNYISDLTGNVSPVVSIPVGQFLVNSTVISFASLIGIIVVSVPAGYALSKKSRLTDAVFYMMLAMIAVPPASIAIPLWFQLEGVNLTNTYLGIILLYVSFNIPFSIVISRAFFRLFPKELEEAARVDGAGDLRIFATMILPLSVTLLAVLAVVNLPNVWNELLFALIMLQTNSVRTIQPGLLLFTGTTSLTQWGDLFAGLVLSALPLIIFYVVFQRYFARAAFLGALKG